MLEDIVFEETENISMNFGSEDVQNIFLKHKSTNFSKSTKFKPDSFR